MQEVENEFGVPVISIVRLDHLVEFLGSESLDASAPALGVGSDRPGHHAEVAAFRARYGVPGK
jgi:hypothetical protein